ncbi:Nodulation-signaling pathway 2 protein, partial [Mucuna pruriens]
MDVYDLSMDFDPTLRDHQESEEEDAITWRSWSPTPSLNSDLSSNLKPLTLPQQGMEIENQVSLPHMLEALGEAIYQGKKALEEVILRCMRQKVSPVGEPLERLAFYLCQEGCYLTQEASNNFEAAFKAFYQGLPHGKVAHFVANYAILEALPHDSEVIHIVDFDMGEGSQWPPLIEAIATLNKTLKLTSIKWGKEGSGGVSSPWRFEEIRRELFEHARSCGVKLMVVEKGKEEVVSELKKMNKRGGIGRREFWAFNCMVGLPHMGRGSSIRHVMEFLNLIKSCGSRGIVTFGDGRACEKLENDLEFKSFFERHLVHYMALLESIESHFPNHFSHARTAMECLFVAPYICSRAWLQKWEEIKEESHFQEEIGLEGCRFSNAILMEVREMLSRCEGSYEAKTEGQNDNQLLLKWKETQLVRVSTWRN